jgi:hypothetical protein
MKKIAPKQTQNRRNGTVISISKHTEDSIVALQLLLDLSSRAKVIDFLIDDFDKRTGKRLNNFIEERNKAHEVYLNTINKIDKQYILEQVTQENNYDR